MKLRHCIILILLLSFLGCGNDKKVDQATVNKEIEEKIPEDSSQYSDKELRDSSNKYREILSVIERWSQAINDRDTVALAATYRDEAYYYGISTLHKAEIIERKINWLAKHEGFRQSLNVEEVLIEERSENNFQLSCFKESKEKGKSSGVTAIMGLVLSDRGYEIAAESDLLTEISKFNKMQAHVPSVNKYYGEQLFLIDKAVHGNDYLMKKHQLVLEQNDQMYKGEMSIYSSTSRAWTRIELQGGEKTVEGNYSFSANYLFEDEGKAPQEIGTVSFRFFESKVICVQSDNNFIPLGLEIQGYQE